MKEDLGPALWSTRDIFVAWTNEMPKGQGIPKHSVQFGPRWWEWGPGGSVRAAWGWRCGKVKREDAWRLHLSSQSTWLRAVRPAWEKLTHQVHTLFQWDNSLAQKDIVNQQRTHTYLRSFLILSFLSWQSKERIDKEKGTRGKGFHLLILILADVSFKSSPS